LGAGFGGDQCESFTRIFPTRRNAGLVCARYSQWHRWTTFVFPKGGSYRMVSAEQIKIEYRTVMGEVSA